MTLSLTYAAHCEVGLVRKSNQDSCYVSPTMLIVADGMGGAAAGDLASAVVIREMRAADGHYEGEQMLDVLAAAVAKAGESIASLVEAEPTLDGMGSTATGLMFDGAQVGLVNIGDSRTYLFRDGTLSRLTHDHSWVQSLVDEGRISEEESLVHPHRSLILRVINGQPQHVPDVELSDVRAGDRLLVCSDGLCGTVTDAAIERAMPGAIKDVMPALVGLAHDQGAPDNISIILADVAEGAGAGMPQVFGSAALLDLDAPLDTLSLEVPRPQPGAAQAGPRPAPAPASPEHARYAPTSKHRMSTWVKVVLAVVVPLLVIVGGGWAWYSYTQQQYFVGPDGDTVAIFQGIPDQTFHLPLSHVVQPGTTLVADLPAYYQAQVRQTISVPSLTAGQSTLAQLQQQANWCLSQQFATPQPTAQATPDPLGCG